MYCNLLAKWTIIIPHTMRLKVIRVRPVKVNNNKAFERRSICSVQVEVTRFPVLQVREHWFYVFQVYRTRAGSLLGPAVPSVPRLSLPAWPVDIKKKLNEKNPSFLICHLGASPPPAIGLHL